MKMTFVKFLILFTVVLSFTFCSKNRMDIKPNKSIVIPTTLTDLQGLLDNDGIMNRNYPYLGEVGSDDYYLPFSVWNGIYSIAEKNAYTWSKEIYGGETVIADWDYNYRIVLYANVVLEGLTHISTTTANSEEYDNIKGQALFFRSMAFYNMSQIFGVPYSQNASNDLSIPLRKTPDINEVSVRSTVQGAYDLILTDLKTATKLLPITSKYKTRPSKAAAHGLLAKVYLSMHNYQESLNHANEALKINSSILDYNELQTTQNFPNPDLNEEVIFLATLVNSFLGRLQTVDTLLYQSYHLNDLRRDVFFTTTAYGTHGFKGSYNGDILLFAGIATDELFLIKAECSARLGNISDSMSILNTLMINRFKYEQFQPKTASSSDEAIKTILNERRKELIFRGLRWHDLRRLNKDSAYADTLYRQLEGEKYTLLPNDLRYVYPIPDVVMSMTNMPQNQR